MQKLIEGKPIWKWTLIYIVTLGIGYLLFPAAWGGINGLMVGGKLAEDPSFRQELLQILTEDEVKHFDVYDVSKLPEEKRMALQLLLKKKFKEINWLPIHLLVNVVTFAVLGSTFGLFLLSRYAALIPVGLLVVTWRSLSAEEFVVYTKWLTIFVGVLTQLGSVYLFSFALVRLRKMLSQT